MPFSRVTQKAKMSIHRYVGENNLKMKANVQEIKENYVIIITVVSFRARFSKDILTLVVQENVHNNLTHKMI